MLICVLLSVILLGLVTAKDNNDDFDICTTLLDCSNWTNEDCGVTFTGKEWTINKDGHLTISLDRNENTALILNEMVKPPKQGTVCLQYTVKHRWNEVPLVVAVREGGEDKWRTIVNELHANGYPNGLNRRTPIHNLDKPFQIRFKQEASQTRGKTITLLHRQTRGKTITLLQLKVVSGWCLRKAMRNNDDIDTCTTLLDCSNWNNQECGFTYTGNKWTVNKDAHLTISLDQNKTTALILKKMVIPPKQGTVCLQYTVKKSSDAVPLVVAVKQGGEDKWRTIVSELSTGYYSNGLTRRTPIYKLQKPFQLSFKQESNHTFADRITFLKLKVFSGRCLNEVW